MNPPKVLFTKEIQPPKDFPFVWSAFDFIKPEAIKTNKKTTHSNIIITSPRALTFGFSTIEYPEQKNYYVVGEKTEKALNELGLEAICIAQNAQELCPILPKNTSFSYLASDLHLPTLPNFLGSRLETLHVYTSLARSVDLNTTYDAYVFFSPSGVESFKNQHNIPDNSTIFALGKTTANAAKVNFPNKIIWPKQNRTSALCAEIKIFYTK